MYVIKDNILKISVRNLVEFILRSGDISSGTGGTSDVSVMQEGARLHRKIQKSMGDRYHSEVPLRLMIPKESIEDGDYAYETEYYICLEGRADGIICNLEENSEGEKTPASDVVIDEIKTMQAGFEKLDEPVYVHKAQAMCYGYIYALKKSLENIGIQITYMDADTEQIKRFKQDYTFEQISEWFNSLIAKFMRWSDFVFEWRKKRQQSIQNMQFPFDYRKGQRDLVVSVYRCISSGDNLYIQAPTGVGKTISTVFPAVAAMGQEFADKIFYLTSKSITRTVAKDTFLILKNNGLNIRTVTLTARDKICCMDERKCEPDKCPYAKGHFDRVNDAVYDLITNCDDIDRNEILLYAEKYNVCPFEMALDVSYWCDAIICDYNYVFDPNVALKRYFASAAKADYIFLVDEAHNLVDRAREMYSAAIKKEDFLKVKRKVKDWDRKLASQLERCNKEMLAMKRQCDTYKVIDVLGRLPEFLTYAYTGFQKFLERNRGNQIPQEIMDLFFSIRHFLNMYDCSDTGYVIYSEHNAEGEFLVRLYCVDPSNNIKERLAQGRSTVFFSATLLPVNYFKEMLSGNINDYAVYALSPFDTGNRCVIVGRDVSSRYTRRGIKEYEKISRYIEHIVKAHPGKYMVFFPSYTYMEAVYEQFFAMYSDKIRVVMQDRFMKESDKEEFLSLFSDSDIEGSLIGFCVNGGIFSEGIDLKNESLIGTVIVGTGLPMVCREREILKNYFDECGRDGYAYSYIYPGMNKVLQAAGRVIRTEQDKGVIILLDDRFLTRDYVNLYPREWDKIHNTTLENVDCLLSDFWKNLVQ